MRKVQIRSYFKQFLKITEIQYKKEILKDINFRAY